MADEAASFNTEIWSICVASTASRLPSNPSMSTSGAALEPPKVPIPRTRIMPPSPPGAPLCVVTVTPGAMPWSAVDEDTMGRLARSSAETDATEPVRLTFFCVS